MKEEAKAGAFRVLADNAGRYTIEGPKTYLASPEYAKRIVRIESGEDMVANESLRRDASIAMAVCVSLQTDYAG